MSQVMRLCVLFYFVLNFTLNVSCKQEKMIKLFSVHPNERFQVSVESEDRMTAIVIRVEYEMLIRGDPLPRGQGIHIHTRDTRDLDDDRKNGILVKSSSFVVDSMVQLRLTPANIRTLVVRDWKRDNTMMHFKSIISMMHL